MVCDQNSTLSNVQDHLELSTRSILLVLLTPQAFFRPKKVDVALKVIEVLTEDGETWEDLVAELQVLQKCKHPNISKFYVPLLTHLQGAWVRDMELFVSFHFFHH